VASFAIQVRTPQEAKTITKDSVFSKSPQQKQIWVSIFFQGQVFWLLILTSVSQVFSKSLAMHLKIMTAKKDHIKDTFGCISVFYHFQKTRS